MISHKFQRRFSTVAALNQLLKEGERKLETDSLRFLESFNSFSTSNAKLLQEQQSRLLPVQEQRVAMVLNALVQLNTLETRAFFSVYAEKRRKEFAGVQGKAEIQADPLGTGEEWPFNHPVNLEFQEETAEKGLVGLHGLPKDFAAKLQSGEAYQSLDNIEVAASVAPSAAKEEKKVEEPKEEKTSFNLTLKGFTADGKLKVIKEIKTILNLGLKEAKEKVESAAKEPAVLYKNVTKESLKATYEKLEAAGAILEWT